MAREPASDRMLPWLGTAGALGCLELASRTGVVPAGSFPPLDRTLSTLAQELMSRELWLAIGQTLQGWALGLGIASALAIPVGIAIGSSPLLHRSTRVLVELLRPIPSVALIPLAVLLYGNGLASKVLLATFAPFWVLLVQTNYGVQDVEPVARDTARSFGCSRFGRLLNVTLPSALPYMATGLRLASSVALIVAVTAELVIGAPGLGRAITTARISGNLELTYALVGVAGLLGWLLNDVLTRVERRLLHWHTAYRRTARRPAPGPPGSPA